nr:putative ribonuclease H-like domain-containing protein [Tanacetum cinerariifolium]
MLYHYKLALAQVEARLAEHRNQELKYCEKIRVPEFKTESSTDCIEHLKKELEFIKKEKEGLDSKLAGFQTASKDLDSLLESQRLDKNKEGLGYSDAFTCYRKYHQTSTIKPKSFIKFVKANDSPTKSKTNKVETAKKPLVKYAEQYKKPTKKPNGSSQNNIDDKGYWDSGCSRHMTGNISYLSDYEPFDEGYVSFGHGGCKITGKGTIKTGRLEFENVYFLKDLKYNLFSVSQICDNKNSVLFTDSEYIVLGRDFKLLDYANVLLRTPRQHNMYSINLSNIVPHKDLTSLVAKASANEGMLWHRRLGYLNFKTMNRLVRHNLVRGLSSKCFENDHTCTACLKGKQHKASCKSKLVNSITKPLYTLHIDLFGPTSVSSISHKWYCLVVIDDFSRFTWTFFLKTKDETSGILRKFITEIENLKVKIIRCDNRGEFRNKEMDDFCSQKGIKREFSNARTPQRNGVAERRNMTLIEAARTMLADAKLPVTFWAEVVNTAFYVQNKVLVNKSHNKAPYKLFNGRSPAIGFLKPFGCHVMILNTLDHLGKFEAKEDECYFIGYSISSKAFRVFNKRTKKVEENLHVEFLENKAIEKGAGPNWLFDIDSLTKSMNYVPVVAGTNSTKLSGTKDAASQEVKKDVSSLRYIALPNWVHDALLETSSNQMETLTVETPIPTVSSPVPSACLTDSQEPSSDTRLISKKVANQVETPSLDNILTLTNRFEDILGVTTNSDESNGMEADVSNMETTITASPTSTLRIHKDHPKSQIISLVDTPIQTRNKSKELCREFEALMHEKFQMSAMGELNFFLALQVLQKEDGIFLSQDKYVGDILKKFRYLDVRSLNTPMDKENPWGKVETRKDVDLHLYRSMIGYLMSLTASRPDIMFVVCACVRHQVTPKECHLHAVKRIFRYLKGHPKLGLWYPKESIFDLVAYSDSDYGGATQDRKSTTQGCQVLGRRLISWQCKKQTIMATSTTEAEYVQLLVVVDKFYGLRISCLIMGSACYERLSLRESHHLFHKIMARLQFCNYHNMVAILEKSEHNVNFHPIVDFVEASPLSYASTFKPTVYVSHIRQFWSTARIETTEKGTNILATVDGILRTITESSLRRNLKLKDEQGISSLLDAELFENLTLMGYSISPNKKFTFQKGQFSYQWKYLIHTIMQCLSPKSIGFKELSSNIATALVCLATNRVYNFSKMIFDDMAKNVNNKVLEIRNNYL